MRISNKALRGVSFGATAMLALGAATEAGARSVTLTLVSGLSNGGPVADGVAVPGAPDAVLLLELRGGAISLVDRATGSSTPFLAPIGLEGAPLSSQAWAAAYSLALAPDFATSGLFYVSFSTGDRRNVLVEYRADPGAMTVDPATQRQVLSIDPWVAPSAGAHMGGAISFGPDGHLYMTTGDNDGPFGAGSGNPGQDVTSRLGKVLRIDPTGGDAFPDDPANNYAIPPGNPDLGPGADPAIFALGLRNPYKGKWDAAGEMFLVADVGEDAWEEVNRLSPGANYGWDAAEGPDAAGGEASLAGEPMLPVHAYSHAAGPFGGISVTGGLIASGGPAALDGLYLFTDYGVAAKAMNAPFWTLDPGDFGAGALAWDVTTSGGALTRPIGYAQDAGGRIYLFDQDGEVWEVVSAAVPAPAAGLLLAAGVGVFASRGWRRRQATSPKITPASTAPTSPKPT